MRVLVIDTDGTGLDLCYRAAEADHEVKWFQPKENGKIPLDGNGFSGIEKVTGWKAEMLWAKSGLIVNLFNGPITKELDRYREFGFPVFGPSSKSSALEVKRSEGMRALETAGIDVPPYKTFTTLQDAMKYAGSVDKRLVFKTLGDEADKSLSYCAHSPEDMVGQISAWIEQGLTLKGPCMLQDFIEGIELGVSGWMGKDGFLPKKWNLNVEYKKMMSGGYGPSTGEMGTFCKYAEESKLADAVLAPMENTLKKLGHIGDTDINCIIDEQGKPWPLEWTNRFGWPSTQILMEAHEGDPVSWMKDALSGKDSLKVSYESAMGVLMAAPPFPYSDEEGIANGMTISGVEDNWDFIAPWQLMLEKGDYKSTGPYVLLVRAIASEPHDVIPKTFAVVDRVKFPNRIVRDDIGKNLEKNLPILHSFGFSELPEW